ncbi:F0F1 ATP synthase subunit B [Roseicyclus sp. F158]|uniref:ATP synthase subunit b n=1 Tax=Tropicimonas omnivorans TaxID=3075590 RepID=A0ABU3DDK8_9RHOB|nr:F0F1 ATP synthase subunit B [Roseicyclus sp. F158]MDT0681801.1 F0F1 ATP synthase subunit B [Roseicyclus sp. F158]
MIRIALAASAAALAALPAQAATGPFFSLGNTNFVVLLAFILFLAILVYFKVPGLLMKMLDKRATTIRSELDEARALREEAQTVLAEFERKQKDVQDQAQRIVAQARTDAEDAARQAKADLEASITRRMATAEEQIASAEASAVREVRNRAIEVATAAAARVLKERMTGERQNRLIDESIGTVEAKLH